MKLRLSLLFFLISAAMCFVLITGSSRFRAQTGKGKPAACCGLEQAVGPRELDFPYYSLRDGFNSTLYLVSDSPKSIPLTITVRNLSGQAVFSTPTIQPQQRLTIDLRALLVEQGADPTGSFAEGSVAVYFTGTIMPVVGQITMTNPVTHLVHESEMLENDPGRTDIPPVLNGLWWGLSGGRDARIMVSNTRGQSVVADVFLEFLGQSHPVAQSGISFMPHETKVLSVTEMLGGLGFSPAQVPEGGITIMAHGGVGGLMAQGKILDPVTGFSTTLRFPSPASQLSNALHAVGIPIGKPSKDSPFVGMGMFIPHVVLRNMTSTAQTATLTIEYPQGALVEKAKKRGGGKGKASTSPSGTSSGAPTSAGPVAVTAQKYWEFDGEGGDSTGQLALPPVSVPAYSTQEVSLLSAFGQLPLPVPYASVRIQYTGAAGGMIAEIASVDESNDLVVDSRAVNEGWTWAGSGANPFHLDDQTESILFLTDMGDKPVRMGFFVSAGGVTQILTQLKLDPHETRAINLRKFRDAQRPDFKGHRIPADASDGSVGWVRIDNVPVAGRVVTINRKNGTASNYDCCMCPCPASSYPINDEVIVCDDPYGWCSPPISVDVAVNGGEQLYAIACYVDCNGVGMYDTDVTDDGWTDWWVDNSSIATVDTGYVSGQSAGTTTVYANYGGGCADWYFNGYDECECDMAANGQSSATVNVADGTPNITSVSPNVWPAGATTTVTLGGMYFGTNTPGLTVTGIIKDGNPTIISYSDTPTGSQLIFSITVDASDPGNTASIVVTSNGYGGNGFMGGGSPSSGPSSARIAAPVNFRQDGPPTDIGGGQLMFFYKWDSSTGNPADLSSCAVYEVSTYGDGHSPFFWPDPPWNYSHNNPVSTGVLGSDMHFDDTQANGEGSWTKPYQYATFNVTQYYKYSCNGPSQYTLMGPITITRTVSQNANGTFMYQVTKSGSSATLNPLP